MRLKYHRRKPAFTHAPITEPGLYDIREYDYDDILLAREDGISLEEISPRSEYQIWVELWAHGELGYMNWAAGPGINDVRPVENLETEEWITQRQIARPV